MIFANHWATVLGEPAVELTVLFIILLLLFFLFVASYGRRERLRREQALLKTCPRCAEQIKGAALVCLYCGHEFAEPPAHGSVSRAANRHPRWTLPLRMFRLSPELPLVPSDFWLWSRFFHGPDLVESIFDAPPSADSAAATAFDVLQNFIGLKAVN